jgi:hypothetical protein
MIVLSPLTDTTTGPPQWPETEGGAFTRRNGLKRKRYLMRRFGGAIS